MCGRIAQIESLESRTLFAVTVTEAMTAAGSQLRISGTAGRDRITVTRIDRGYAITAQGGFVARYRGNYKSLEINGGRGNDKIVVASAVKIATEISGGVGNDTIVGGSGNDTLYGNAGADLLYGQYGDDTLVTVGDHASDRLSGGAGSDSFWTDSASTERVLDLSTAEANTGNLHRIASYLQTPTPMAALSATTSAGANLVDPTVNDSSLTYINYASHPLFGRRGPSADDVVQGDLGDCYLLASVAAVADVDPSQIRQTVADLGDGTYAVRFHRGTQDVYVHVDADLPSWSNNQLAYADFGADGSMWVAVIEKAYALFRGGDASYQSIDTGWMSEAFDAMGLRNRSTYDTTNLGNQIDTLLKSGKAVTYATADASADSKLLSYHAYTVDHVVHNSFGGVTAVVLRNPWGVDGATLDGNDDGYVTIKISALTQAFSGLVSATA